MHAPAPTTLKGKALQLLAARDYSRAELQRKLHHWLQQRAQGALSHGRIPGVTTADSLLPDAGLVAVADGTLGAAQAAHDEASPSAQEVAQVLDELQAKGYLSDTRAAQALVHRRADKLGNARIQQELQRKGLDAAVMQEAMDMLSGTELARARQVWRKKFDACATTPTERARQMRFLASRGFGAEVVHAVLHHPPLEDDVAPQVFCRVRPISGSTTSS